MSTENTPLVASAAQAHAASSRRAKVAAFLLVAACIGTVIVPSGGVSSLQTMELAAAQPVHGIPSGGSSMDLAATEPDEISELSQARGNRRRRRRFNNNRRRFNNNRRRRSRQDIAAAIKAKADAAAEAVADKVQEAAAKAAEVKKAALAKAAEVKKAALATAAKVAAQVKLVKDAADALAIGAVKLVAPNFLGPDQSPSRTLDRDDYDCGLLNTAVYFYGGYRFEEDVAYKQHDHNGVPFGGNMTAVTTSKAFKLLSFFDHIESSKLWIAPHGEAGPDGNRKSAGVVLQVVRKDPDTLKRTLYLAYKGTVSNMEWIQDIRSVRPSVIPVQKAIAGAGFATIYRELTALITGSDCNTGILGAVCKQRASLGQYYGALDNQYDHIVITGHSLGGALSNLAMWDLISHHHELGGVGGDNNALTSKIHHRSFASPRSFFKPGGLPAGIKTSNGILTTASIALAAAAANTAIVEARFKRADSKRIVGEGDVVPMTPFASNTQHVGLPVVIGGNQCGVDHEDTQFWGTWGPNIFECEGNSPEIDRHGNNYCSSFKIDQDYIDLKEYKIVDGSKTTCGVMTGTRETGDNYPKSFSRGITSGCTSGGLLTAISRGSQFSLNPTNDDKAAVHAFDLHSMQAHLGRMDNLAPADYDAEADNFNN